MYGNWRSCEKPAEILSCALSDLTIFPRIIYNKRKNFIFPGGAYGLHHRTGGSEKVGRVRAPNQSILCRGPHPRRGAVRRSLGHSRGCRKARRPPQTENANRSPKREASAGAVSRLHAPDEHPIPSRVLQRDHCPHGSRSEKGHCPGGVPLFQRAGRKGHAGNGRLSYGG